MALSLHPHDSHSEVIQEMMPMQDLYPYLIYIVIATWSALILFLLVRKMTQRGKLRVEILKKNRQYVTTLKKAENDKIDLSSTWQASYDPLDFFEEDKPSFVFWRLPRRKLIIVENMKRPLRFKDKPKGSDSDLMHWWTPKEIGEFIVKEIAKAKSQIKPMSRIELLIILLMLGMNLMLLFAIAQKMGIFQ